MIKKLQIMTTATYKSLLFYAPKDIRLEDVPVPEVGAGEVLVRIKTATTCGTDKKTFERGHPVIIKSTPSAFGHEMAGVVEKIGENVTAVAIGDRVVVANSAPCLDCFYCKTQKPNLCENLFFLNGAFAELILVPQVIVERNLYKIPDTLSFDSAALSEPLACVIHAAEQMGITTGEAVAVIGTGPMAFLFIEVVRHLGGKTVIIGRNEDRLRLARDFGAETINSITEDVVAAIKSKTDDHGADVAIEAVGLPATWQQAVSLVRKGGRVCLYGGAPRGTSFALDTYRVHYEEIIISGIFHHTPKTFKMAVEWLSQGKIRTTEFISEKRSLADVAAILSGQDKAEPLKFVIRP